MSAIKKFFEKKKSDAKFKVAGPGHKLTGESSSRGPSHTHSVAKNVRHNPSEGAKRAGAAAMARFEQHQKPDINWSHAAIRAQARKELELEIQAAEKSKSAPKEVRQESAPVLAVSGVYYTCPLVGSYILPRREIEEKIKEFLYIQLEEDSGLAACHIIHTCNKNKEKVAEGVETLSRYLTNIINNPTEEKYCKIRINNKVFQEKVAKLEGAFEFLNAVGFEKALLPHGDDVEDFLVYPKSKLSNLNNLFTLNNALLSAEPIVPSLDRNLKVLMPSQAATKFNLPDEFFNLTAEEVLKEHEKRVETVELNTQLRTRAMRERDEIKEMRKYKYTLIRIRFPDGIILQGTFSVRETLSAVIEFVCENLADSSRQFTLVAPGGEKQSEIERTLLDLHLVPATILNLCWNDNPVGASYEDNDYLTEEAMALLQLL